VQVGADCPGRRIWWHINTVCTHLKNAFSNRNLEPIFAEKRIIFRKKSCKNRRSVGEKGKNSATHI